MSSFVKMWSSPYSENFKYSTTRLVEGASVKALPSLMGAQFKTAVVVNKDGEIIETTIKAGQAFTLRIGTTVSESYHGFYQPNAKIFELCNAVTPAQLLEPGETVSLDINAVAKKAIDIADLGYVSRLYMID